MEESHGEDKNIILEKFCINSSDEPSISDHGFEVASDSSEDEDISMDADEVLRMVSYVANDSFNNKYSESNTSHKMINETMRNNTISTSISTNQTPSEVKQEINICNTVITEKEEKSASYSPIIFDSRGFNDFERNYPSATLLFGDKKISDDTDIMDAVGEAIEAVKAGNATLKMLKESLATKLTIAQVHTTILKLTERYDLQDIIREIDSKAMEKRALLETIVRTHCKD